MTGLVTEAEIGVVETMKSTLSAREATSVAFAC